MATHKDIHHTHAHGEGHEHHEASAHTAAKKSSKNPLIYIGIGCLALVVLGSIISVVVIGYIGKKIGSAVVGKVVESQTGMKTNVEDLTKGKMTFTDPQSGNSVSVGTDTLPENFPKDMPIYPGAQIVGSASGSDNGSGQGYFATFTTSDPKDTVTAYYKKELTGRGWETKSTYSANGTETWAVSFDGLEGTVTISGENDATTIVLTVTHTTN